ncbi:MULTISPECIES: hypothetical protein [unclassified Rickettsia]|uniref:hypothetical protein n=1 Tax=unclassified Rickettsia TaxID=114295 RepID=UPI00313335D8
MAAGKRFTVAAQYKSDTKREVTTGTAKINFVFKQLENKYENPKIVNIGMRIIKLNLLRQGDSLDKSFQYHSRGYLGVNLR